MTNLTELADRVEALEGPCREADAVIWDALGLVHESHCRSWCRMDGRTDVTRAMFLAAWSPEYTASLDAAMTLVPEGLNWQVGTQGNKGEAAWSLVEALTYNPDTFNGISIYVDAATPAIALCAAALRARETLAP